MTSERSPRAFLSDFRRHWKDLGIIIIACRLIGVAVTAPLLAGLLHLFMAISGQPVLADQGILNFVLSPLGGIAMVLLGAISIALAAMEFGALMAVLCGTTDQANLSAWAALRFSCRRAAPILSIAVRVVVRGLLVCAPFLLVATGVGLLLLTEYDISYYLAAKPPMFWLAGGLIGVILVGMIVLLLRSLLPLSLALPIVFLEGSSPKDALRISRGRTRGKWLWLIKCFVFWAMVVLAAWGVESGLIHLVGRLILPQLSGSGALVVLAIGVALLLWAVIGLAITVVSVAALAIMLAHVYRVLGGLASTRPAGSDPGAAAARRSQRGRILVATAIVTLLSCLLGAFLLSHVNMEDSVLIIAHRGASVSAPENTLSAIEQAIVQGADYVEIDVQETMDGEVIVFHDSDFQRMGGAGVKVWDATLEQIKAMDVGRWFSSEFQGERVPTLAEVLAKCKGRIHVLIELKSYGHGQRLEQRVVEIVETHKMVSEITVMSLNREAVDRMRALRPRWRVGLLTAISLGDLTNEPADFLAVGANLATSSLIRAAHRRSKDVYVWTVNDPVSMALMIGKQVDGLITDRPDMARKILNERKQWSPMKRLLFALGPLFGLEPTDTTRIEDF